MGYQLELSKLSEQAKSDVAYIIASAAHEYVKSRFNEYERYRRGELTSASGVKMASAGVEMLYEPFNKLASLAREVDQLEDVAQDALAANHLEQFQTLNEKRAEKYQALKQQITNILICDSQAEQFWAAVQESIQDCLIDTDAIADHLIQDAADAAEVKA